jgi:hypothetical protein
MSAAIPLLELYAFAVRTGTILVSQKTYLMSQYNETNVPRLQ